MQATVLILGVVIGMLATMTLAVPVGLLLVLPRMLRRVIRTELTQANTYILGEIDDAIRSILSGSADDAGQPPTTPDRPRHLRAVTDTFAG